MTDASKTEITVVRREAAGVNVRVTFDTGYDVIVPRSHPLASGAVVRYGYPGDCRGEDS